MKKNLFTILIFIAAAIVVLMIFQLKNNSISPLHNSPTPQPTPTATSTRFSDTTITQNKSFVLPISNALSRVTKKPFGIYITPKTSPVQPEKFSGYHTGADFEVFDNEKNVDVPIFAICTGKLAMKKYASGYGGVAVQECTTNNNPVTIVYGHLRLSSVKPSAGDNIKAGEQIAVLGTGYSNETDGERKHLHLGIHKGSSTNILGYVQKQSDLSQWIDPLTLLK